MFTTTPASIGIDVLSRVSRLASSWTARSTAWVTTSQTWGSECPRIEGYLMVSDGFRTRAPPSRP